MLYIPLLLLSLILAQTAQIRYIVLTQIAKGEIAGVSTTHTVFTQTPSPTYSPKTVIPESSASPGPLTKNYQTELLQALNNYRQKNGQPALSIDSKLQTYSRERSDLYLNIGKIDNHDGFNNLLKNDGFKKLDFMDLAENSSFGYSLSAKELIENIFGKSETHNKNMLNPIYTHIGIAVSGSATNFVFGGRKI